MLTEPVAFDFPRELPLAGAHVAPALHAAPLPRLVGQNETGVVTATVRGRKVGFPSEMARHEVDGWRRVAEGRRDLVATTVADYAHGDWSADAAYVIRPGVEPRLLEVLDFGKNTDNGHVRLVAARDRWVHPDTVIFLAGASRSDADDEEERSREVRSRFRAEPSPGFVELRHDLARSTARRLSSGGSLTVWLDRDDLMTHWVLWRRDGRALHGHAMSVHDGLDTAREALEKIAARLEAGDLPSPGEPRPEAGRYDRQRAKVYKWDDAVARRFPSLSEVHDLAGCQRWADLACTASRGHRATVVFNSRLERRCLYRAGVIELAAWGRTTGVVLHEVGHHAVLHDTKLHAARRETRVAGAKAARLEPHGPEYVGWMMRLYALAEGVTREGLEEEARSLGLRWTDPA